jgi:hypothetical protein
MFSGLPSIADVDVSHLSHRDKSQIRSMIVKPSRPVRQ